MFWFCGKMFPLISVLFLSLTEMLYSRRASELPTPGSDLVMTLGCEYMLVATEMLLLRVDSVDIVSGLRRRDSSLSLPLISRKSVDISPSERQPSAIKETGKMLKRKFVEEKFDKWLLRVSRD